MKSPPNIVVVILVTAPLSRSPSQSNLVNIKLSSRRSQHTTTRSGPSSIRAATLCQNFGVTPTPESLGTQPATHECHDSDRVGCPRVLALLRALAKLNRTLGVRPCF